jgi:hypothetical protein
VLNFIANIGEHQVYLLKRTLTELDGAQEILDLSDLQLQTRTAIQQYEERVQQLHAKLSDAT